MLRHPGMKVLMGAGVDETMRSHAVESFPDEACGLLLGVFEDSGARVHAVRRAANAAGRDRDHRFAIHPRDVLAGEDAARASGWELVGFYHSHPNVPASPSDLDHDASWPGYVYAIVSVLRGQARHITFWSQGPSGRLLEASAAPI